ncbi:MAG: hypothetical protein WBC02_08830, partial [Candidatus Aminicenantaceae bacterium]
MRGKKEKSTLSFRKKLIIAAISFFFVVLLLASFFGKKGLIEIYRVQREHKILFHEIARLE